MEIQIQKLYQGSNPLLLREESVLRYVKGGYRPVCLGDTFKIGRYQVEHKLGHGGFSTVGMADEQGHAGTQVVGALDQWVSLEIIVAAESEPSRELAVLQALARHSERDSRSHNIAQLLDNFFDIIVNDYHEEGRRSDIDLTLSMSIQLLEAKGFLQEFGYAHGDVLGPTECEELVRMDGQAVCEGLPKFLIHSTQWPGWLHEDEEGDDRIWVIDLGQAFQLTTYLRNCRKQEDFKHQKPYSHELIPILIYGE
ncbi:hypothetical protein DV735_g2379, partial [Chaetothyriales sp. CBS 134920]